MSQPVTNKQATSQPRACYSGTGARIWLGNRDPDTDPPDFTAETWTLGMEYPASAVTVHEPAWSEFLARVEAQRVKAAEQRKKVLTGGLVKVKKSRAERRKAK